ncbi:hypothetical protein ANANG_G00257320 [Anguilla anguilla]|uniref:Uncharacterized protein n=1 Tax=Anguilla anguilla TaxID=7936 RepID=A0A9D3LPE7_ANGAN|nr:hypothetical protein ANANG_G00257320 [Anguilla anguilla]
MVKLINTNNENGNNAIYGKIKINKNTSPWIWPTSSQQHGGWPWRCVGCQTSMDWEGMNVLA